VIGRDDIDSAGLDPIALARLGDRQGATPTQQFCHVTFVLRGQMGDHYERQARVRCQVAEEASKCFQPAGGGAEGYDRYAILRR
jgi:hypothetical protein